MITRLTSVLLAVVAAANLLCGCQEQTRQAPTAWNPVFRDIAGQEHRPGQEPATRAIVLVFMLTDCPIANSYLPVLNRLHVEFAGQGVSLLLVHADPATTNEEARKHAEEYEVQAPVLLDPQHELVRLAKATKTPQAVVFSPAGDMLYSGRIDDRFVGLGKARPNATTHDLREALVAILAGQPVRERQTEAVGCFIPMLAHGE